MQGQQQHTPILLFLLQYNKFSQIIKSLLNETVSNNLLAECGFVQQAVSKLDKYKVKESSSRFTVRELIYIKGSSYQRVRENQNKPLMEIVRKKLETQNIDDATRKELWLQFTDIFRMPNFYEEVKALELPTQFQINIQKDILRTYKSPQIKQKTSQILESISKYNPFIGYCQGMHSILSFIASEQYTCQQGFFIFKYISQQILPCEYYSSMDCIMTYMRIFYQLLNHTHPKIYVHLKHLSKEIDNSYIAMVSFVLQWFVCLFCQDQIHQDITKVVWDFLVLDGIVVLFKAALGMFDLLEKYILKCNSFQSYTLMQKTQIRAINDAQHIRNRIMNTFISSKILMILKSKLMEQGHEKDKKQTAKKSKKPGKFQKKCNRRWTVCLYALQKHLQQYSTFDFFVFKPKGQINIIQDYLGKMNKMYFNSEKIRTSADELKIGRSEHICHPQEQLFTDDSSSQKNSEESRELRKKYVQTLSDPKSPFRLNEQMIRKKAVLKVEQAMNKRPGMQRSDSMIFMQKMVQNVSLSNLLQLYEVDQMFQQ